MQNHQLIIMRHAKSDWSEENRSDFDRPLTDRGRKAAERMGKWLKQKRYRIDRIICSPALRAKQTCQLVAEQIKVPGHNILFDAGIYEASLNDLTSLIDRYGKEIHTLLLIGHNPGLDQLLCNLSQDPPPVNSAGKLLTTASLAVLDFSNRGITTEPQQGHLRCLIRPKELTQDA